MKLRSRAGEFRKPGPSRKHPFVDRLVDTLLAGSAKRVYYQRPDRSIILNASSGQPYARVVPDILIERSAAGTTACVAIDAKYKLYDERKLSSSDVYQNSLYAHPTAPLAVQSSLLHFSCIHLRVGQRRAVRLWVGSAQALGAAESLALGLSNPDVLAELTGQIHGLPQTLLEAVQQGLGVTRHAAGLAKKHTEDSLLCL